MVSSTVGLTVAEKNAENMVGFFWRLFSKKMFAKKNKPTKIYQSVPQCIIMAHSGPTVFSFMLNYAFLYTKAPRAHK